MFGIAKRVKAKIGHIEEVTIEEIGLVKIRRVTAGEMLIFSSAKNNDEGNRQLLAAAVIDESGKPVFASIEELAALDWPTYRSLLKEVLRVNRIGIKEAEKNSPTAPSVS